MRVFCILYLRFPSLETVSSEGLTCRATNLHTKTDSNMTIVFPCSQRRLQMTSAESGSGKRINQTEFTEKAWQSIVNAPEVAKSYQQQIVETEHLLKGLLEQPNGLARRIVSKAGSDPSRLLDTTESYIRQQPRVSGDSGQVSTSYTSDF